MESRNQGNKPFDWEKLYDSLLRPSDGYKKEDGTLNPKYEVEELRNKLTILGTRAFDQKMAGENVDGKVRKGLIKLKDRFPTRTEELKGFVEENDSLKDFTDVFNDKEK